MREYAVGDIVQDKYGKLHVYIGWLYKLTLKVNNQYKLFKKDTHIYMPIRDYDDIIAYNYCAKEKFRYDLIRMYFKGANIQTIASKEKRDMQKVVDTVQLNFGYGKYTFIETHKDKKITIWYDAELRGAKQW